MVGAGAVFASPAVGAGSAAAAGGGEAAGETPFAPPVTAGSAAAVCAAAAAFLPRGFWRFVRFGFSAAGEAVATGVVAASGAGLAAAGGGATSDAAGFTSSFAGAAAVAVDGAVRVKCRTDRTQIDTQSVLQSIKATKQSDETYCHYECNNPKSDRSLCLAPAKTFAQTNAPLHRPE